MKYPGIKYSSMMNDSINKYIRERYFHGSFYEYIQLRYPDEERDNLRSILKAKLFPFSPQIPLFGIGSHSYTDYAIPFERSTYSDILTGI